MQDIKCNNYSIFIGDFWLKLSAVLEQKSYSRICVLCDENTEKHCLPIFKNKLDALEYDVIKIKSGELHKNLGTCQYIWKKMIELGMDRHSVLLNLGGGVIGDMGGFCAASFMRGIDFIQIPTSLLAQVDASVGSKVGIDFMHYKNLIGFFQDPVAVCIYPKFLETLSNRELRSGFAEVIKHSLIFDETLWKKINLSEKIEGLNWETIIAENVKIKKQVVESDPFEKGARKILNFGHSIGHAIESAYLSHRHPLLHGEAIAIGMICSAYISSKKYMLDAEDLLSIKSFIFKIFRNLPKSIQSKNGIIKNLYKDKKNKSGKLLFSIVDRIGNCKYDQLVKEGEVLEALNYYASCQNN